MKSLRGYLSWFPVGPALFLWREARLGWEEAGRRWCLVWGHIKTLDLNWFYLERRSGPCRQEGSCWLSPRREKQERREKKVAWSMLLFSRSVVSSSLQPHGLQHIRPPCPSLSLRVCSNSCPLSWWCHPGISSSVIPFLSHLQSFPASGSFPKSQFFASGGQSIGISASTSVLLTNIQDWFPLGVIDLTGLIVVQGTLKNLQHHSSKASILQQSAFFTVQLSHLYMTTGKIIALTMWTFVSKLMSLVQRRNSHDGGSKRIIGLLRWLKGRLVRWATGIRITDKMILGCFLQMLLNCSPSPNCMHNLYIYLYHDSDCSTLCYDLSVLVPHT